MKPIIDKILTQFPNVQVVIDYAGEGDSGDIFDIRFIDPEDQQNRQIEVQDYISNTMETQLRDFVYDLLETLCPGWEINEGSEGSLIFYKDEDNDQAIKVKLEHGERRVEIDWTEEEYCMTELSEE